MQLYFYSNTFGMMLRRPGGDLRHPEELRDELLPDAEFDHAPDKPGGGVSRQSSQQFAGEPLHRARAGSMPARALGRDGEGRGAFQPPGCQAKGSYSLTMMCDLS